MANLGDHMHRRELARLRSIAVHSGLIGSLFALGCTPSSGGASQEGYGTPATYGEPPPNYDPGSPDYAAQGAAAEAPAAPDPVERADTASSPASAGLRGTIGPEGGELQGEPGSPFARVRLSIPAGALSEPTEIAIAPADEVTPLPASAVRCGPLFELTPAGLMLAAPASLTLPVDRDAVFDQNRMPDEVKVWVAGEQRWSQRAQVASSADSVSIEIERFSVVGAGVNPPADMDVVRFALRPNPKFVACLAEDPRDRTQQPEAEVAVVRGAQNDALFLRARNLRPGLAFSLFTVENTELDGRGATDRRFRDFGVAQYQSDFDADARGVARTSMRSILLDKNFVFDQGDFGPTSTFHVGFWFDDPEAAAECGFDPEQPTPFNEEHEAGPMAMISLPQARGGLGPLCTNADTSSEPVRCVLPEE